MAFTIKDSAVGTVATPNSQTQTQAGALALLADYNVVTYTTAGDGVLLPVAAPSTVVVVKAGATAGKVYPANTGTIDGGGAGAAVTPTASKASLYLCTAVPASGVCTWITLGSLN